MSQSDASPGGVRLRRYEERTGPIMMAAAFGFLVLFAVDVLWLDQPPALRTASLVLQTVLWLVFVVDFGIRIALSERKVRYVATHPIDVLTIVLPMLRVLRVLRVFAAIRVLFERGKHLDFFRVWAGMLVAVVLLVLVSALVVLDAERGAADSLITSFPDALWWAFVTISTVGYGDEYPITAVGQVTAVLLMISGIGLLGTVTATVATWFRERMRTGAREDRDVLLAEMHELKERMERIETLLSGRNAD